jgi:Undecaprenyl-phosphate glucose phosphotransferase
MTSVGWDLMLREPTTSRHAAHAVKLFAGVRHPRPELAEYEKIQPHYFQTFLFGWDVVGAVALALGIFNIYALPLNYNPTQLWISLAGFIVAWAVGSHIQDLYGRKALLTSFRQLLLRVTATCAFTFGVILLLGFGLNLIGGVSRVWLLTWAASVFVWAGLARVLWRVYLRRLLLRDNCIERALVLAGSTHAARRLTDLVERESRGHIRVAAAAELPGSFGAPTIEWVEEVIRGGSIDRVIVGSFSDTMAQANALLARLTRLAIDVSLLPDLDGLQAPVLNVDRIGMLPTVDLDFRPLTPGQVRMKRVEDLILAGIATLFVSPLLLAVSLAVKLDSPGPVLFRQPRAGFNGRTFVVWKFRTMYAHTRDDLAVKQTSRGDSRVTRVGGFLRRTSIDELPQLFNVLNGDMAIVGPRPHPLGMTAVGLPLHEAIEEYAARHRLKPGITGWAQINGNRGEVDSIEKLQRRVALDCHYIENWSLGFDLWIILRTAAMLLSDPNAY